MDKNKSKAYAAIALETLYKTNVIVSPEILLKQMDIAYEVYDENDIEFHCNKLLEENKRRNKEIDGRVNSYIVNVFDSSAHQRQSIERFCKSSNIELRKVYITPVGENSDKLYELIKDIRGKTFDILIVTIFSIYAILPKEWAVIVKLCRENDINIIEI